MIGYSNISEYFSEAGSHTEHQHKHCLCMNRKSSQVSCFLFASKLDFHEQSIELGFEERQGLQLLRLGRKGEDWTLRKMMFRWRSKTKRSCSSPEKALSDNVESTLPAISVGKQFGATKIVVPTRQQWKVMRDEKEWPKAYRIVILVSAWNTNVLLTEQLFQPKLCAAWTFKPRQPCHSSRHFFNGREELQITYPIRFSLPRVFCKWQFVFTSIIFYLGQNDGVFLEETLRFDLSELKQNDQIIRAWVDTSWSLHPLAYPSFMVISGWLINKLILMLQFKKCVWRWKENRSLLAAVQGVYGNTWYSNKTVMVPEAKCEDLYREFLNLPLRSYRRRETKCL